MTSNDARISTLEKELLEQTKLVAEYKDVIYLAQMENRKVIKDRDEAKAERNGIELQNTHLISALRLAVDVLGEVGSNNLDTITQIHKVLDKARIKL